MRSEYFSDGSLVLTVYLLNNCKKQCNYEGWNFNSGNYLFTTDTK